MKRYTAIAMFLLMGILTILLCSCRGEQPNEWRDLPEEYALSARFEDAGGETEMMRTCLIGDTLYYYTESYDIREESSQAGIYIQKQGNEAQQQLNFGKESGSDGYYNRGRRKPVFSVWRRDGRGNSGIHIRKVG